METYAILNISTIIDLYIDMAMLQFWVFWRFS